ncbi:MAG TPA: HAD family phosphatase [Clostridia bacterium]|nr:HAD family phosphatase [Clostridia bacterium]
MQYKLIAIDMDDTLLRHDKTISKENIEALHKAREKDVYVVISTGRVFASAYAYADMIGFRTYIIASNGALIRDPDNNTIYESILNYESMIEIIKTCQKYNTYFQLINDTTVFSPEITNKFQRYAEWNDLFREALKVEVKEIKNPLKEVGELKASILKIIIFNEDADTLKKIREELSENDSIQITSSYMDNIEIVNKGVSKGRALEILGGYLGIKREEMIAIGDSENDIEMIKFAGLGVAVENAIEEVKKIADFITKSNMEDGVKYVIDNFILSEEG